MSDLTTIEAVKLYMGKANADLDPILTSLISQVSAAAQSLIGYSLLTANYDLMLDGNGAEAMYLPSRPITAVSALELNGVAVSASPNFYTTGYAFESSLIYLRNLSFPVGTRNIRVAYTSGYANIGALPADITGAINETVALRCKERDWTGFKSKSLAGETVTFEASQFGKNALACLNTYKMTAL